jgi:hypothetical protein
MISEADILTGWNPDDHAGNPVNAEMSRLEPTTFLIFRAVISSTADGCQIFACWH